MLKLIANINNRIETFTLPFQVDRNIEVHEKVDSLFFNEINCVENRTKISDFLKKEMKTDRDIKAFDIWNSYYNENRFNSLILHTSSGLNHEASVAKSNIYRNLSINTFNNWAFNLITVLVDVPNVCGTNSACILKNSDIKSFIENIYLAKEIFSHLDRKDYEQFIKHYEEGRVLEDVIITHDFYFPEELEISGGYGEPEDILMSEKFLSYLKESKGQFRGFDYNAIVRDYIETENDIQMSSTHLMNAYIEHVSDVAQSPLIIPEDYENITFELSCFSNQIK